MPADSAHSPHSCGGTASVPTLPAPPPGRTGPTALRAPVPGGEKSQWGEGGDRDWMRSEARYGKRSPSPVIPPSGPPPRSPPPPAPVTTAVFLALVMPPGRCAGPRRKEAAAPTLRAALRGVRGAQSPSSLRHRAPRLPKTAEGGGGLFVYRGRGGSGGGPVGRTRIPERFPVKSRGHRRRCPGERSGADPGVGEGRSARGRAQREAAGMEATNRERGSSGRGGTGRCWGGRYLEPLRGAAGPGPAP